MEAIDEATPGGDAAYAVTKGKRTKRQRLLLLPHAISPSSSGELELSDSTTTEEEEDMANCLILLAQGRAMDHNTAPKPEPPEKFRSRRFAETATTTTNAKAGFYVYECKTCSKCFPSFQALGGHRASHKKPKPSPVLAPPPPPPPPSDEDGLDLAMNSFVSRPFVVPSSGKKSHECSICGAEFSSGQALGGHMRRHRPIGAAELAPEMKREERMDGLSLDLNLPAPAEEGFGFSEKPPPPPPPPTASIVFSASALVDCHY